MGKLDCISTDAPCRMGKLAGTLGNTTPPGEILSPTSLTAPIESGSRNRHLGYLDSLRGIAILMVLWVHAGIVGGIVGPAMALHRVWPLFFVGQRGVELFYEVSAFTLFLSLSRSRGEHAPLRNFYLRRFFRIAPAFYLALLFDFLWVGRHVQPGWCYGLALLFVNGWSSIAINFPVVGSWSIAVEFMFYVSVPLLYRKVRGFWQALWFFLATWALAYVTNRVFAHRYPDQGEYFMFLWPVAQAPVFAMGILAFQMYQQLVEWRRTQPALAQESNRKLVSAFLLLTAAILFRSNFGRAASYVVEGSFCFVPLLLAGDLYAWPLLFNRPLAWIGKISFSMYLLHFFPLHYMITALTPDSFSRWSPLPHSGIVSSITAFVVLACISIPLSWLTWRFVEVPGIELGRRVIRHLEGRKGKPTPLPTDVETSTPGFQF